MLKVYQLCFLLSYQFPRNRRLISKKEKKTHDRACFFQPVRQLHKRWTLKYCDLHWCHLNTFIPTTDQSLCKKTLRWCSSLTLTLLGP